MKHSSQKMRQTAAVISVACSAVVCLLLIGGVLSSQKGIEKTGVSTEATDSVGVSTDTTSAGAPSISSGIPSTTATKKTEKGTDTERTTKTRGNSTAKTEIRIPEGKEINVVEAGADPTGKTDCTKLLTALHKSGKRIYYPNGTYLFNGLTLDFSGGVRFQSPDGVIIRNSVSDVPVVNFDEKGNLIGLMQNHLESTNDQFFGISGSLVSPPLSSGPKKTKVDFIPYWYNDFGLQCTKWAQTGWIGWYYWTWNHHGAEKLNLGSSLRLEPYDATRHPLLGFYRGDDPTVLDWQCYWLLEYGSTAASLLNTGSMQGWEQPTHRDYWLYQLFNKTPNFKKLKYIMNGYYGSPRPSYDPAFQTITENGFYWMVDNIYAKYDNYYCVEKNGKKYPVISILEETQYRTVFNGDANVKAFYRKLAERFRSHGFGGFALYARAMLNIGDMAADGVLRYETSYTPNYTISDYSGRYSYADLVDRFNPPVNPGCIISVGTAIHTKAPHESRWKVPGNTPALFSQYLKKAIGHLQAHPEMPQVLMCYNMSEWAEGGPGLVPTVGDGFGYLRAIADNNIIK